MKRLLQTQNYFILSTGRTGTTFLHKLLTFWEPSLACFQEPRPSWIFQIYSNLKAERKINGPFKDWIAGLFSSSRSRLLEGTAADRYLEISPFLYGLGEGLRKAAGAFKVVHIVRHPFTCIPSMLNFNPQGWRRFFMDLPVWSLHVGRALPDSAIRWKALSKIEKKAWQWRYINQKIESYQNIAQDYLRIPYEHLFSDSPEIREEAFRKLLSFLGLVTQRDYQAMPLSAKVNQSQTKAIPPWKDWDPLILRSVLAICAERMEAYGYRADGADSF